MNHRHAALLLLLLPAACAGGPPPKKEAPPVPPAEIFRIMEQRLADSTSLRIHVRGERFKRAESGAEERNPVTAFCFLRGESQAAVQVRSIGRDGQPLGPSIFSDGARMLSQHQTSKPWRDGGLPDSFTIVFRSLLHRIGVVTTTVSLASFIDENRFLLPSAIPAAANFRSEETKDGVACLSYTVVDLTSRECHVKLWYDPKTLRPQRRRVGVEDGQPGLIYDETYEDYTLDPQIPDARFVLPDLDGRQRFASDGKSLIYEEREGAIIHFVVIADGGVEGELTADGIILRRGSVTQTIKSTTGMTLLKGRRTLINAIPNGWDHDLVQEYLEYRAAHPKGQILDWLKEAQKRRPTPMIETYLSAGD